MRCSSRSGNLPRLNFEQGLAQILAAQNKEETNLEVKALPRRALSLTAVLGVRALTARWDLSKEEALQKGEFLFE